MPRKPFKNKLERFSKVLLLKKASSLVRKGKPKSKIRCCKEKISAFPILKLIRMIR
jgi:hypothetical protein